MILVIRTSNENGYENVYNLLDTFITGVDFENDIVKVTLKDPIREYEFALNAITNLSEVLAFLDKHSLQYPKELGE